MVTVQDLTLADGRVVRIHDTLGAGPRARLTVFWHHGTPNVGEPPAPLFPAAAQLGIRWIGHDRPGYGGSTAQPGRTIAAVAADLVQIADALGVARFAVMGHSGGASHALACAALLPGRVLAAVCIAGLAPLHVAPPAGDGLDWFAGMAPAGAAELRAASAGRAALEHRLATSGFDPEQFTPADHAALAGAWAWLGGIAAKGMANGLGGMVDDDLAYVAPWGCDLRQVRAPLLLVHGGRDRIVPSAHAVWLARHCATAKLWLRPEEGHISILSAAAEALEWLIRHGRG